MHSITVSRMTLQDVTTQQSQKLLEYQNTANLFLFFLSNITKTNKSVYIENKNNKETFYNTSA